MLLRASELRRRAGVYRHVRPVRVASADGLLTMITPSHSLEGCARGYVVRPQRTWFTHRVAVSFRTSGNVGHGAGGRKSGHLQSPCDPPEFAQLLTAAGVGGSSLSTSRAVWNDVKYAEVFVKHFLRWNDFGGLSI